VTDITLGLPVGGFYWRGSIPGDLCGATVSWACTYVSEEPVAIPPFIEFIGQHVVVSNILPNCGTIPNHVSPGTLTLTPTVTCPDPVGGSDIVMELTPLTLTIGKACASTQCPLENGGFEDGVIDPWVEEQSGWSILTDEPQEGTYYAQASNDLAWLTQTMCLEPGATGCGASGKAKFSEDFDTPGQVTENEVQLIYLDGEFGSELGRDTQAYNPGNSVIGWNDVAVTSTGFPAGTTHVKLGIRFCVNSTYGNFNTNSVDAFSFQWT